MGDPRPQCNVIFVTANFATGYAWNCAPIYGTDVLRSILDFDRELHFPIDINFNTLSKITQNNAQATLEFLKLIDSSRHFSSSIFKFLLRTVKPPMQNG